MPIAKVIKYEGDNTTFVWKYPGTDFNNLSQLIVHENQEAVFFKNGQALDLFEAGKYTLDTDNIPILRRFFSVPFGGRTPFHCEVYFVNKAHNMAIKWGTDSQIQYMDPKYHFPLQIGASGEMVIVPEDSRKLLIKLVGTEKTLTQDNLISIFRAFISAKVKPYIATTMQGADYSVFETDSHMEEFSNELREKLKGDFEEYGLTLQRFMITNIAKPDGEPAYEKFKELHIRQYADVAEAKLKQQTDVINAETEAKKTVIESQARATVRSQEGYTYQQERGFDVADKAAENEGAGQLTSMGVGLGMMAGVGGSIGNMVGGAVNSTIQESNLLNAAPNTGNSSMEDFKQKLEKLKLMNDMGMISEEEFASAKADLLKKIIG